MAGPSQAEAQPGPAVEPPICHECGYVVEMSEEGVPILCPCLDDMMAEWFLENFVEFRRPATAPSWCRKRWRPRLAAAPPWCRKQREVDDGASTSRAEAADSGSEAASSTAQTSLLPVVVPPRHRASLLPSWAALVSTPLARCVEFVEHGGDGAGLNAAASPRCRVSTVSMATNFRRTAAGHRATLLPTWALLLPTPEAWAELRSPMHTGVVHRTYGGALCT